MFAPQELQAQLKLCIATFLVLGPVQRDFAAWLGLVPKQLSTGDRTILGGITKRGNRYLRTLFIQGARAVLLRRRT